ncbi:hypothetical protein CDD81_2626 [Ophiocordyceps australis]|uniref:RING-type domain-containing protein n=1 Tax=Ophiocordyceps australis TaxID=1399860 RepID=A0A2C5XXP7_9HYPO|nr:hypothetical protein CDD81_2626 [Ophiocordyceps australis]
MSTPPKSPTPRSRDRFLATPSPIVRSQWWPDLRLPQSSSPSSQHSRFRFAAFDEEDSLDSTLHAFDDSLLPQSSPGEQQSYSTAGLQSNTSDSSFSSGWTSESPDGDADADGESSVFVSSLHLGRDPNSNSDVDDEYRADDESPLGLIADNNFSSPSTLPSIVNLAADDTTLSPQSSLHSSQSIADQSTLAGNESDSGEDSAVQFVHHSYDRLRSLNALSRESSLFLTDSENIPSPQESTQTTVFDMPPRQLQNLLNSPEPPPQPPASKANKRRRLDSSTNNAQNSTSEALVLPQRPSFNDAIFSEDTLDNDSQAMATIDLTVSAEAIEQQFSKPEPDKRIKLASFQCVICMDDVTALTVTHCGHLFCQQCLHSSLHVEANRGNCPMCRTKIDTKPRASYTSKTKGYWPLELKLMTVTKKGKRKADSIS